MDGGHGEFIVGCDDSIILFRAFGSWNRESSVACVRTIEKCRSSMRKSACALLIDSRQFVGVTSDSEPVWNEAISRWFRNGQSATIRVDSLRSIGYKIFLSKYDELFRELGRFEFHESVVSGIEALHAMGFTGFENGLEAVQSYGTDGTFQHFW